MKILKGQLKETRYAWPTVKLNKGDQCPLETTQETIFSENEVTYMSDKLGLHKITNVDPNDFAISLHCTYIPCISPDRMLANKNSVHTPKRIRIWLQHIQRTYGTAQSSEDVSNLLGVWKTNQIIGVLYEFLDVLAFHCCSSSKGRFAFGDQICLVI
jgi:hypothetical protein